MPPHAFLEVMNTVGRECPDLAVEFLAQLFSFQMTEVRLDLSTGSIACDLMQKLDKVSFYDVLYHATALKHGGIFVTADEKYYQKAKGVGGVRLLASR
mgnify:CR=1 FL=1